MARLGHETCPGKCNGYFHMPGKNAHNHFINNLFYCHPILASQRKIRKCSRK